MNRLKAERALHLACISLRICHTLNAHHVALLIVLWESPTFGFSGLANMLQPILNELDIHEYQINFTIVTKVNVDRKSRLARIIWKYRSILILTYSIKNGKYNLNELYKYVHRFETKIDQLNPLSTNRMGLCKVDQ